MLGSVDELRLRGQFRCESPVGCRSSDLSDRALVGIGLAQPSPVRVHVELDDECYPRYGCLQESMERDQRELPGTSSTDVQSKSTV